MKSITLTKTPEVGGRGRSRGVVNFSIAFIFTFIVSCGSPAGDSSNSDGLGSAQHRMFVTSSVHDGDLDGLEGADAICQTRALAAGLSRTYKALLGTSSTEARERITLIGAVYVFTSAEVKVPVVNLPLELWSGNLLNPVNRDENYNLVVDFAWTGADDGGSSTFVEDCLDWTSSSNSQDGSVGDISQTDAYWLEDPIYRTCDSVFRLYCISQ